MIKCVMSRAIGVAKINVTTRSGTKTFPYAICYKNGKRFLKTINGHQAEPKTEFLG